MAIGTRYHRIVQVQLVHNEVDFYLRLVFGIHHVKNEQNHIHLSTFYQFLMQFQPFEYSDSARWYTVVHSPVGAILQEIQNLGRSDSVGRGRTLRVDPKMRLKLSIGS